MSLWYQFPALYDRSHLLEMLRSGWSIREICEVVGCTRTNVYSAMRNHGIMRPFVESVPEKLREKMRL
ncbi:hypothetical protein McpSp1_10700 [Methanocorpusculaceae archaeon Sp1]|nr:hypothetical protein [Methanocorpusculaceae archaeon Sp1]